MQIIFLQISIFCPTCLIYTLETQADTIINFNWCVDQGTIVPMQSPSESLLDPLLLDKVQNLRQIWGQMSSAVLTVVDAKMVDIKDSY